MNEDDYTKTFWNHPVIKYIGNIEEAVSDIEEGSEWILRKHPGGMYCLTMKEVSHHSTTLLIVFLKLLVYEATKEKWYKNEHEWRYTNAT